MSCASRSSGILREALIGLGLALLLLRMLVPAGWMPAAGGEPFAMAICSGDGIAIMAVGPDDGQTDTAPATGHDDGPMQQSCTFAGLVAGLVPAAPLALTCRSRISGLAWGALPGLAVGPAIGWALPAATGPPPSR